MKSRISKLVVLGVFLPAVVLASILFGLANSRGAGNRRRTTNTAVPSKSSSLFPWASALHSQRPSRSPDNGDIMSDPDRQHGGGSGYYVPIQMELVEGVLNIIGNEYHQRIVVYQNNQGFLVVSYNQADDEGNLLAPWVVSVFDYDSVNHVIAFLYEGNDTFVMGTEDLECTVYGGPGNDFLHGSLSDDALHGEEGGDAIFGGDGQDYVEGGPQSDVLCGGSGLILFDPATLDFRHEEFPDWISSTFHLDDQVDTLRGGPEDPNVDADWFIEEVLPDENDQEFENDTIVDFNSGFDWISGNDHFWE